MLTERTCYASQKKVGEHSRISVMHQRSHVSQMDYRNIFKPVMKVKKKCDSTSLLNQQRHALQVDYRNVSLAAKTEEWEITSLSNPQSHAPQLDDKTAFDFREAVLEKEGKEMSQFKVFFAFWVAARRSVLLELEEAFRKLLKLEEISEITSSINKSVGITGAVAAVAGSILLPFTFGLSSAGVVSGAIVSLSSVTAMTASKVAERRSVLQLLYKCLVLIELDRERSNRLVRYIAKEKVHDLSNSSRLAYRRNVSGTLAYLRSCILSTHEDQNVTDDYVFTAQDFSEGDGLLEDERMPTKIKAANRKISLPNSAVYCSTREYNITLHLITALLTRLSKCVSIDKKEMESEKEKLLKTLIKLDKTEPILPDAEDGSRQPKHDSERDSSTVPSQISDNRKLDSEDQFEKCRKLEEIFFEAVEKYKNSKNIHYNTKSGKVRSKPKSIRSLIYILKDLKNSYYDELFMFAEYHKFLAQKDKNLCCKHGCVTLFYYRD